MQIIDFLIAIGIILAIAAGFWILVSRGKL